MINESHIEIRLKKLSWCTAPTVFCMLRIICIFTLIHCIHTYINNIDWLLLF